MSAMLNLERANSIQICLRIMSNNFRTEFDHPELFPDDDRVAISCMLDSLQSSFLSACPFWELGGLRYENR
jgi:hypothetical protein